MALKLYGVPLSPFARMAHAVAELTNNEVEYVKERFRPSNFIRYPLDHCQNYGRLDRVE